jgi:hypothetical protein
MGSGNANCSVTEQCGEKRGSELLTCDVLCVVSILIYMPLTSTYVRVTSLKYEGRLKISWTRLITPCRNFVEVR